jgi:biotin operon repressor
MELVPTSMTDENPPEPPEPSEYEKWHHENSVDLDIEEYDFEEYDTPDWITELDREICSLLNTGLVLTPAVIAKNLDRPRSSVSRRINTLEAGGIITKVERGHYHLTGEGWAKMNDKIFAEDEDETSGPSPPDGFYRIKVLSSTEAERVDEK